MFLGISGNLNYMLAYQAEHKILMHPSHMLAVAGMFGGSLCSAMNGSLLTSPLVLEATASCTSSWLPYLLKPKVR
jgi:photosystem II P680 reaction center D1 protein